MRYVAKLHVVDVMENVVVSGYIHEHDGMGEWSPELYEFSYAVPGVGLTDPYEWLDKALQDAVSCMRQQDSSASWSPAADGGPHTLSESSDPAKPSVG
jgi:hypothetical protein